MSEKRNGRGAEGLAVLVADGTPADWDEALRSASTDQERRIIGQLRLLESVARILRGDESAEGAPPAPLQTMEESAAALVLPPAPAPESWGPLELREKLGEGGFGEVYRAWDGRLDREVALKLLRRTDPTGRGDRASAIVEEGRLLAKLHHPNVVTVFGAEVHDGRVGIWMELIRGRSLEQLLRDHGPLGAREAALVGADLCRALAAVHGAGVIHRDVKAANAMREEGGRILLMDFGAGIDLDAQRGRGSLSVSGTPMYMAPELFLDGPATQRSDIYSLGVVLYRLVTRAFPVEASSWDELRGKHERRETKLLRDRRPDLPEGFVAVVERATAWRPEERFATPGHMEQALALAFGAGSASVAPSEGPPSAPMRKEGGSRLALRVLAFGLLALAVVAGLYVALTPRRETGSTGAKPEAVGLSTSSPAARAEGPAVPTPSAPYTVEAALYRVGAHSDRRERLDPGSRLGLGDDLTLEFKASAPLYVYVIDEDEAGHSYALFPLPELDRKNPLPADTSLVLPGSRNGRDLSWSVDSQGGREHLMVLASPTRLVEFEAELNGLARAGQTAVPLPEEATLPLRGIGGMHETPPSGAGKSAGRLFEMAQRIAARPEVVSGVWMRQIELENPRHE